jgi:hypothetical protein
MRQAVNTIFICACLWLCSGCAPSWKLAGQLERCGAGGYAVAPPQGWMIFKKGSTMLLSKHGVPLEYMYVGRMKYKEPLSNTTMSYDSSMLPHELAEVASGNLRSNPSVTRAHIVELSSRRIDDIDATRVVFTYKTQSNVTKKALVYLFLLGPWTYELSFCAAERYYFDYGAAAFDSLTSSFKLSKSLHKLSPAK